mmetsp:Transcript_20632/g.56955  ORF Transcript_20632/g.56955 Transcript_20632/m.56955 type:complete len:217 (-) Transcript_20632:105-755(-)
MLNCCSFAKRPQLIGRALSLFKCTESSLRSVSSPSAEGSTAKRFPCSLKFCNAPSFVKLSGSVTKLLWLKSKVWSLVRAPSLSGRTLSSLLDRCIASLLASSCQSSAPAAEKNSTSLSCWSFGSACSIAGLWLFTAAMTTLRSARSCQLAYARARPFCLTAASTTSASAWKTSGTSLRLNPSWHTAARTSRRSDLSPGCANCSMLPQRCTAVRTTS